MGGDGFTFGEEINVLSEHGSLFGYSALIEVRRLPLICNGDHSVSLSFDCSEIKV